MFACFPRGGSVTGAPFACGTTVEELQFRIDGPVEDWQDGFIVDIVTLHVLASDPEGGEHRFSIEAFVANLLPSEEPAVVGEGTARIRGEGSNTVYWGGERCDSDDGELLLDLAVRWEFDEAVKFTHTEPRDPPTAWDLFE